jgi:hypothetical protein
MDQLTVRPAYDGRSLPNLSATVCALFGADGDVLPALTGDALPASLLQDVDTVLVLLVDGLGLDQLRRAISAGDAPALAALVQAAEDGDGHLASITSVFPSATMAALASLHTAVAPDRHGVMGWTVYLEEFGQVVEMARWGPVDEPGTSYQDARLGGHDPLQFLGAPTIYRRLAERGVRSFIVNPIEYRGTALSRMLFDGAKEVGYRAPSGMGVNLERLLADATTGPRRVIYAYYAGLDSTCHTFGPRSAEHAAELAAFDALLGRFVRRAPRTGRTLCLLTADHGHVFTPPDRTTFIDQFPTLLSELIAPPNGERRLLYLHARPGRLAEARDLAERAWGAMAEVRASEDAFQAGLFGPGPPTLAARRRAGDLLVIARGDAQFTYGPAPDRPVKRFAGNHGGLAPDEMMVPLLAWRL